MKMKSISPVGSAAPAIHAVDGKGETFDLAAQAGKTVVLVFLRHLGCPICRMEIAEWKRRVGEFHTLNAEVVVFVDSPDPSVQEFAKTSGAAFRIVADPEHKIYGAYGVERGSLLQFAAPGAALRSLKATLKGNLHGKFEGDELRLPGDFVVGPDGKLLFARRGEHIGDNAGVDALLAVVKSGKPVANQGRGVSRRAFLAAGAGAVVGAGAGVAYYNHKVDTIAALPADAVTALYDGGTNALFDAYPGLRGKLPWAPLGAYPTPVELLAGSAEDSEALLPPRFLDGGQGKLYVKRDDKTHALYGGNKVRKLEHVLAEAKLLGRKSLLTVGGIGSNQCLATSIHGGRMGFKVDIALFDQPATEHVVDNLLADRRHGANFVYGGGFGRTAYRAVSRYVERDAPYYIPAGASLPIGNVGYITASLELARQLKDGLLPEPDFIYVAAGSCGTAAGLVAGCKLAGLKSKVVAVRITDAIVANAWNIAHNANAVMDALREMDPSIPAFAIEPDDLIVEAGFFGPGYGVATPAGLAAIEDAKPVLKLDPTYTGKTLAAARAHARRAAAGTNILFWNTLNSAVVPKATLDELPADIQEAIRKNS